MSFLFDNIIKSKSLRDRAIDLMVLELGEAIFVRATLDELDALALKYQERILLEDPKSPLFGSNSTREELAPMTNLDREIIKQIQEETRRIDSEDGTPMLDTVAMLRES